MKKILISITLIILIAISGFWVYNQTAPSQNETDKISITASFYPLAFFAEQVGGELVEVHNVTPTGVEPHDFEPSPRDIQSIQTADLFIYNGAGFDAWAEKVDTEGIKVEMAQHLELITSTHEDEHAEEEEEAGHEESEYDPHFWLDPIQAQIIVEEIKERLTEIDPENSEVYSNNAQEAKDRLQTINNVYQEQMATCLQDEIVVSHNAYTYMGERYGFGIHSIAGISPDEEATPQQLAALTEEIREENIKYVLFETLVSPRIAETLANETGAQTLVLNPIEGLTSEDVQEGENYYTIMEENLETLTTARECN